MLEYVVSWEIFMSNQIHNSNTCQGAVQCTPSYQEQKGSGTWSFFNLETLIIILILSQMKVLMIDYPLQSF